MRGILLAILFSAAPCGAAEPILGFNFPVWWHDAYGSPRAVAAYGEMAGMGAGWVAIIPTLYTADRKSDEVAVTDGTASDGSLRLAIRLAHAQGLKVLLKPHVDMANAGGPRSLLNPSDAALWFKSYGGHIERYAVLAAEERCEMFAVGTELAQLTEPQHTAAWRALIARVRKAFPGPLTYAANWHSVAVPLFWKDLDYIGVDGYFPLPGGSSGPALDAAWRPWALELRALSKLWGRPILFTEIGIAAQTGANLKPWAWDDFGPLDQNLQAVYMESFLRTFGNETWVAGFFYWAWEADAAKTGPLDKSMSVQGKPAEQVLRRAFARSKAAPLPFGWRERLEDLASRLSGVRLF